MTEDNELIETEGTHTARHIASLRALSEWLIANDHDMALPDSVDIDPEDSADKMAAMMIELVSLRAEVAAYRNHEVVL